MLEKCLKCNTGYIKNYNDVCIEYYQSSSVQNDTDPDKSSKATTIVIVTVASIAIIVCFIIVCIKKK